MGFPIKLRPHGHVSVHTVASEWSHGAPVGRGISCFTLRFQNNHGDQKCACGYSGATFTSVNGCTGFEIQKRLNTRSWLAMREEKRVFHNLMQKLGLEDHQGFHDFLRMKRSSIQESLPCMCKMNMEISSLSPKGKWCSSDPMEYSPKQKYWCYDYMKTKSIRI